MKSAVLGTTILILLASLFQCRPFAKPELPAVPLRDTATTEPAAPSPTDAATHPSVPSAEPQASPTPTSPPAVQPTPTATPLPEGLSEQIEQTYTILVLIQFNAHLLSETATRVQSGELEGFEALGALLAVAALIGTVDESIPQTVSPDVVDPAWNSAIIVHEQTKQLAARWLDKEVDSGQVVAEMQAVLRDIDEILTSAEAALGTEYNLDSNLLTQKRQEIINTLPEIFE